MTTTTEKEFSIIYPVTSYVRVTVTRDANISEEDLLASISKDDLVNGSYDDDGVWDDLKEVWRSATPGELSIQDENWDEVFTK